VRHPPLAHAFLALIVLLAALALPALAASTTHSEPPDEPLTTADTLRPLDLTVPRERAAPNVSACRSIVHRACAAMPPATPAATTATRGMTPTQTADQVLERVVIEGERLRRPPSVREALETATARQSWREMESGEGGRCICANPCPAWPQACCVCTKGGRDAKINNIVRH